MSSSSSKVSKKPINKKMATPVRGPFGQRYDPETGSVHRDFPRIVRSADPGSPPSVNPPVPNTIPKSFDKQKSLQNTMETNYQQEWHASVRQQIINQLLLLNPSGLPSQAKLQGLSSVQLARWAIPTLTAADPTGVIAGTASSDSTTMEELVTALQNTAASTYSKNQILAHFTSHKQKLNDNFETLALSYVDEFPSLPSSPARDYGPMNAVEASKLSSKRPYQPTPLELIGSSQSKRHSSVAVSAATVATQVGLSSSIPAKQGNPGQRQIVPTKHFGEYHGSDKITQLATDILPGALTVSSPKPTMSKSSSSQDLPIPGTLPPPSNHFDMYVAEKAAMTGSPPPGTIPGVSTSVASIAIPVVTASASSRVVIPNGTTSLSSKRVRAGLPPDSGDDDSISSSSSSVTPLNDVTVPNNDFVEDESLIVAQGVHSDLFENCFTVRMSASNNLYHAPGTKSDSGVLYGPVLVPSPTSLPAIFPVVAHADDAVVLNQFYQLLRIRLPCTLDMITHIVQQNTQPPSTTFQFMLATGISMGFYLCLRCSEYISKTIVPLEDPHQFLSSDVQFMLNDGSQTLIGSHLVQHHQWHQIKLVKFSLQHAKNIRRAYGVPIWFSARTPAGQDVPFVRLLYHWSQHTPRHRADPFLSYRTTDGLTCLLYADIKKAIKASATIFGLDETWFDTHSVRMSAPTIARATNASPTIIQHMGRWQALPAAMKYQQQSTRLNDNVLSMVSDPTLFTAEDVRLTQLLASRTSSTPTVRRF